MNSDSLTYNGGNTTFKYCSSNSAVTAYINGSNSSSYTGTPAINNSNTTGNYDTIAKKPNSGSYQMYIPTSINSAGTYLTNAPQSMILLYVHKSSQVTLKVIIYKLEAFTILLDICQAIVLMQIINIIQ